VRLVARVRLVISPTMPRLVRPAIFFWIARMGVVQIRVTPKTRNPFTIKALSISGVI